MDAVWEDAAQQGTVATIRDLLQRGADIDARDRYGQTARMPATARWWRPSSHAGPT